MEHLDELESFSIYILRESYRKIPKVGLLWSIGKDSTVLLWLARKAFFGHCPFPLIHVDTGYKIPEMITYRDRLAGEMGCELIVHKNEEALRNGMGPDQGRLVCCKALKTDPLQEVVRQHDFAGLVLGIRRDEEGSRSKERVFSERSREAEWDYVHQTPEFWDQFKTEFPPGHHVRVHPLLPWTELDVWNYIDRENIPVIDLYFAQNGQRYRSLGCAPCTGRVASTAATVPEVIAELRASQYGERAGRAQDQAEAYAMQKLRREGYM